MSKNIEIKNDKLSVVISTHGAELQSIKGNDGTEFLWQGDEAFWSGRAPVLFPICGGLKDGKFTYREKEYSLTKHGFAKFSEFEGNLISSTKACFTLKSDSKTLSVYPFEFVLTITYELIENSIKVTYNIENPSTEEMYFSIGAHEGYSCPEGIEEYCIEFDEPQTLDSYTVSGILMSDKTVRIAENTKTLPLKYEYFTEDALVFKNVGFNKVFLTNKKSGKKITVSFPGFNNFLIWTVPGAKYVCLEPWCGYPDTVNSDGDFTKKDSVVKLGKGSLYALSHTISFEG